MDVLKQSLGEEAFQQLSEDEKNLQAYKLYEKHTVDKGLDELADILIDYYFETKDTDLEKEG